VAARRRWTAINVMAGLRISTTQITSSNPVILTMKRIKLHFKRFWSLPEER
jgi:hypothetical protein